MAIKINIIEEYWRLRIENFEGGLAGARLKNFWGEKGGCIDKIGKFVWSVTIV